MVIFIFFILFLLFWEGYVLENLVVLEVWDKDLDIIDSLKLCL